MEDEEPGAVYAELQPGSLVQLVGQRGTWMLEGGRALRVRLRRIQPHDPPQLPPAPEVPVPEAR